MYVNTAAEIVNHRFTAPIIIYVSDVPTVLISDWNLSDGTDLIVEYDGNNNLVINEYIEDEFEGLKFTSTGNSTVALTKSDSSAPTVDLKYSLDEGVTWTQWDFSVISLNDGDTVCLKGLNTTFGSSDAYNYFEMTGSIAASGNIMSIIDDGACTTTTIPNDYCFIGLFNACHALTSAPELPATTLAKGCYAQMFYDCPALTAAPALPATTLAKVCYYQMFYACTSLTTAPALPATTLADYCYWSMFGTCTSLVTAPALPATTLADSCYIDMFQNCTSLTTAPSILPATTLADNCYHSMFAGCTSLTTAPELPATTLTEHCYRGMFTNCVNLIYIKCLATNISATNCTNGWMTAIHTSGTFVKAASMNDWTEGINGIPSGWIVQNAA